MQHQFRYWEAKGRINGEQGNEVRKDSKRQSRIKTISHRNTQNTRNYSMTTIQRIKENENEFTEFVASFATTAGAVFANASDTALWVLRAKLRNSSSDSAIV